MLALMQLPVSQVLALELGYRHPQVSCAVWWPGSHLRRPGARCLQGMKQRVSCQASIAQLDCAWQASGQLLKERRASILAPSPLPPHHQPPAQCLKPIACANPKPCRPPTDLPRRCTGFACGGGLVLWHLLLPQLPAQGRAALQGGLLQPGCAHLLLLPLSPASPLAAMLAPVARRRHVLGRWTARRQGAPCEAAALRPMRAAGCVHQPPHPRLLPGHSCCSRPAPVSDSTGQQGLIGGKASHGYRPQCLGRVPRLPMMQCWPALPAAAASGSRRRPHHSRLVRWPRCILEGGLAGCLGCPHRVRTAAAAAHANPPGALQGYCYRC